MPNSAIAIHCTKQSNADHAGAKRPEHHANTKVHSTYSQTQAPQQTYICLQANPAIISRAWRARDQQADLFPQLTVRLPANTGPAPGAKRNIKPHAQIANGNIVGFGGWYRRMGHSSLICMCRCLSCMGSCIFFGKRLSILTVIVFGNAITSRMVAAPAKAITSLQR